jgi:hypothetical protein
VLVQRLLNLALPLITLLDNNNNAATQQRCRQARTRLGAELRSARARAAAAVEQLQALLLLPLSSRAERNTAVAHSQLELAVVEAAKAVRAPGLACYPFTGLRTVCAALQCMEEPL